MRILKWKRKIKPSPARFKKEFDFAMNFVKQTLEREKNNKDKIIILDFMLTVIKEDLKTDLLSHILYSKEHFERYFRYPIPLFYYDEKGNEIAIKELGAVELNLAQDCVLALPWHQERLCEQIKNIFTNKFIYDEYNQWGYYFPYIGLCYVYNGIHSVASGIVHKKGTITVEQYDITELFSHIYTDGQNWYSSHNDNNLGRLADFRLGIIYEIAKVKHQLEQTAL